MMGLKCFVFALSLFVCAQCASIGNTHNIHVEVVYDRPEDVPRYGYQIDKRNLQAKNQLPEDEFVKEEPEIAPLLSENQKQQTQAVEVDKSEAQKAEEKPMIDLLAMESSKDVNMLSESSSTPQYQDHSNSIKNLEEKVQLSHDQLEHSGEHIPNIKATDQEVPPNNIKEDTLKLAAPEELTSNQLPSPSNSLIAGVQDIIYNGISNIKKNVEEYMTLNNNNAQIINENVWKDLNSSVDNFIGMLKVSTSTKQEVQNQTFFQTVVTGFQNLGSNFLQNVRPNSTEGDEEQPGFGQNVINFFSGGK